MQKAEEILSEMEAILDQLVLNAEHLNEVSQNVIAEEELSSLQARQDHLMSSLLKLDHDFQSVATQSSQGQKSPLQHRIQTKLDLFEKLNERFVKEIMKIYGLIGFSSGSRTINKQKKWTGPKEQKKDARGK